MVDSTPQQWNMKSIDLLFTLDSSEYKACDVSVANLQSQYTSLYITLTCKEKEKREKEIPVIPDRELCLPLSIFFVVVVVEVRLVVVFITLWI